jgi:hypothetical protein
MSKRIGRKRLLESLNALADVEAVFTIEPTHIQDWSVTRTPAGVTEVSPDDLERVTLTWTKGEHTMTAVAYDRERDIVHAFEMAELFSR